MVAALSLDAFVSTVEGKVSSCAFVSTARSQCPAADARLRKEFYNELPRTLCEKNSRMRWTERERETSAAPTGAAAELGRDLACMQ